MSNVYVFDTNAVSDLIKRFSPVQQKFEAAIAANDTLILCQPVHFEITRGLLWIDAPKQLQDYRQQFVPFFLWEAVTDSDWMDAATLWAAITRRGRKLSDIDLLIAVMVNRLNAVLVSSDADFDTLGVTRENWRL